MAWIESHTVLMRHRKLIGLARALAIRRSYALGHLTALWHTTLEQQEDGDLTTWSDDMIAEAADFPGDSALWVTMLQKHGFLDGRFIHDWPDYARRYVELRYRTANPGKLAQIRGKWGKTDYRQSKDSPPNNTIPNQTEPTLPNLPFAQSSACSALTVASGVEVIKLPLPGERELAITDGIFPLWKQAYPGIDIMTELAKMRAWLLANPKQQKTEKGMDKFINGWLDRAQNSSGGKHANSGAATGPNKYEGLGERV